MAAFSSSLQASIVTFNGFRPCDASSCRPYCLLSFSSFRENSGRNFNWNRLKQKKVKNGGNVCRAMVQQTVQGPSAAYAREMERLSAKESLLLALKDAGGFEALFTGRVTEMQRIDVMERVTALERLNPTPRPTTSPYLEGRWKFEWLGSGTPAVAQFFLERFPTTLANLSKMDVLLKDSYSKVTANLRLLNSVESKFTLSSKLSIEGPLRMKEEYIEGILDSPTVVEESVPDQLKGPFGQAVGAVQQLPVLVRDAISNGIRIPLSGSLQRMFMISYLDEEILIIRDPFGAPEVMIRLDSSSYSVDEPALEYES
ncbi:probable plastid-lipid-associated protein 13, chloroplastic isoform X1 [Chenopodium quinoa]|uniref:probable plastid-lipid-associated protein 13, chloroplastic isoform X1 n=1 Tax=Chenopodium quinoa TaxID=63459 RepID=UPI000B77EB7F|nr:probable plastid-lipid-associated protein 13, chloroplastic isoform X1 [Chenopodium quinoa]XP_021770370.1 probable plastid-lipid-associated protein 13, chloroplastic isoform X1 [Chenopodium quinoa]